MSISFRQVPHGRRNAKLKHSRMIMSQHPCRTTWYSAVVYHNKSALVSDVDETHRMACPYFLKLIRSGSSDSRALQVARKMQELLSRQHAAADSSQSCETLLLQNATAKRMYIMSYM